MRYEIDLAEVAIRNLGDLPKPVRKFTIAQLENLSEQPTLLSESPPFEHPMDGQLCLFDYDHEQRNWQIRILFNYSEDERRLIILSISSSSEPI